ncbi:MAG: GvpL/GvpF family gas vesicle protein [Thermodesulfobacteriota bacterium]
MQSSLYLFCFARSRALPALVGYGVEGDEPLLQQHFRDIAAVYCEVPLDVFTGPSAEQRLQDPAWVGPRAVRHGEVIQNVMQHSPVFPARFGTLFSSAKSLQRLLDKNCGKIGRFLDHVTDKEEWSVKCTLSRAHARERLVSEKLSKRSGEPSSFPTGLRYLKERQLYGEADKELSRRLKVVCHAVASELAVHSTSSLSRDIVRLSETGGKEVVANWAFLVHRGTIARFQTRIEQANMDHNHDGLFFQISGPWPPYSFSPPLTTGKAT